MSGASAGVKQEYHALQEHLQGTPPGELEGLLRRLRELLLKLPVPQEIGTAVLEFFGPDTRLAVRSSAQRRGPGEHVRGRPLRSVVNVPPASAPAAIAEVWVSLWTRPGDPQPDTGRDSPRRRPHGRAVAGAGGPGPLLHHAHGQPPHRGSRRGPG